MANLQPTSLCVRCRYDLRGITSKACPECGTPTDSIGVRIGDPQQYHLARAALEHEGLLVRSVDPGGSLGSLGIVEGFAVDGWLWVDPNHLERVEECLDRAGVVSQILTLPIVDRTEPNCPKCNATLNVNGPETCPDCGKAFQWVEIEEPTIDPKGLLCRECDYDLTGNTSGRCPECDWAFSKDADLLVGAALSEPAIQSPPSDISREARAWINGIITFFIALLVLFLAILGAAAAGAPSGVGLALAIALFLLLVAGAVAAIGLVARLITGR